jgi:hypothetical protein
MSPATQAISFEQRSRVIFHQNEFGKALTISANVTD